MYYIYHYLQSELDCFDCPLYVGYCAVVKTPTHSVACSHHVHMWSEEEQCQQVGGGFLTSGVPLDGRTIWPQLSRLSRSAKSPYFYRLNQSEKLMAVAAAGTRKMKLLSLSLPARIKFNEHFDRTDGNKTKTYALSSCHVTHSLAHKYVGTCVWQKAHRNKPTREYFSHAYATLWRHPREEL